MNQNLVTIQNLEPVKTYVIQHRHTGEIWTAQSGKTSWKKPGHAKNAFGCSSYKNNEDPCLKPYMKTKGTSHYSRPECRFDDQPVYHIVELKHESQSRLEQAETLLRSCLGRLEDVGLEEEIEYFLKSCK